MSDLPCVSAKQAIAAFGKLGFHECRTQGSHVILKKAAHRHLLSVPMHGNRDLKPGTLRALIRAAECTVEEFVSAL